MSVPSERRLKNRFIWKELDQFVIKLELENKLKEVGSIGNISEKGLSAMLNFSPSIRPGEEVIVTLLDTKKITDFLFQVFGKIVWNKVVETNFKKQSFIGIEFDFEVKLPEEIMAYSLDIEDYNL